ncbi:cohesin domain-containing protein [Candidatus Poribacteria bacterium]
MKGTVLASLALSLLLISNISLARDVPVYPVLNQQQVNVGDEFSVRINIDQVSDLKGMDILVSFDNVKLEYKSITKEALIDDFVEDIAPDPETSENTGKLEYVAVLEASGPGMDSPGGTILTINFVARSPGEAWIRLDPNDVSLGDSIANAIPAAIDVDRYTVQIGEVFKLRRVFNYPNPAPDSNGNTTIRVEALALLDELEGKIYDISAERVITIEEFDSSNAPIYEYVWDCRNEEGEDVANGTYILWLKATKDSDEEHETWKIAILR